MISLWKKNLVIWLGCALNGSFYLKLAHFHHFLDSLVVLGLVDLKQDLKHGDVEQLSIMVLSRVLVAKQMCVRSQICTFNYVLRAILRSVGHFSAGFNFTIVTSIFEGTNSADSLGYGRILNNSALLSLTLL